MRPTSRPLRTRGAAGTGRVVAALVLAWAAALGPATPAAAATTELLSPADQSTVTGPVDVLARVTPAEGEVIESVDVRVAGAGERTVPMQRVGDGDPAAPQDWAVVVDPLEGIALANGPYVVEVRARPLVGEPSASAGHEVRLAVPPPRRELTAAPDPEDPTSVVMSWDPVALPDFLGYRIQRRPDADGTWQTVQAVTDPRAGSAVDEVPEPGAYRYRLVVVRSDGDGSELFATSDPRGVRADPDDPGTFDAPRDPDPVPTEPPTEPVVDPVTRPTDVAGGPTPGPAETGTAGSPSGPPSGGVRPPASTVQPPPAPAAPRPGVVPFDDGTFDELLPFDATSTELEVGESEAAFIDGGIREGGSLNVFTEEERPRGVLVALAAGLLLLVVAGHLRRYLAGGAAT
jgi:hypothetical protein